MALLSYDNTGNRLWGKNPINLRLLAWGEPATTSVIVTVESGVNSVTVAYPSELTALFIPLRKLLDFAFPINYATPALKTSGGAFIADAQQSNRVVPIRIGYRLSTDAVGSETWINKILIDGGVGNLNQQLASAINVYTTFTPNKFFPNGGSALLTYFQSGRRMDAAQHGWITFYHINNVRPQMQYVQTFEDGTSGLVSKLFPVLASYADTMWHIPIGILQAGLDPTNKGVYKTDLYIRSGEDGEVVHAQYTIFWDYRPAYEWLDVHFKNSLGGWDSFRFDGSVSISTDAERREHEQFIEIGYAGTETGANPYYHSKLRPKWKVTTRYISAKEMIALNDLLNSTDIRINYNNQWIPIRCITKTLDWRDSKDGLYAATFEFETSGDFETFPAQLMDIYKVAPESR